MARGKGRIRVQEARGFKNGREKAADSKNAKMRGCSLHVQKGPPRKKKCAEEEREKKTKTSCRKKKEGRGKGKVSYAKRPERGDETGIGEKKKSGRREKGANWVE